MPISRNAFDAGEGNLEMAILAFLRDGAEFAYQAEEIYFEIEAFNLFPDLEIVRATLESLTARRRIEAKEISGTVYYSYNRTIGFRRPN